MSKSKIKQLIFLQVLALLFVAAVSCNSKTTTEETEIAVTPSIVAVKNFYIKANSEVLDHLDSVFFTIDLQSGVIFNADSLPKGTDVSRLIPAITFSNVMTKAELNFVMDDDEELTVDYLTNPDDSIDFTHPVYLNVTAQDGLNSFTYQIRVNVHESEPDSLVWNRLSTSTIPSRLENPVAQKTIYREPTTYCLVEEYNGEFTLSTCDDLNEGNWEKQNFSPGFEPSTESFISTETNFYLLDTEGSLYESSNLKEWVNTGETWLRILGNYGQSIIGLQSGESAIMHVQYPTMKNYQSFAVNENFPIYQTSALGLIETEWATNPTAILTGGVTAQGTITDAVWAFDGKSWAIINQGVLPALVSPMLARYVVYRETTSLFREREFDVWMLFGGINENGEMNRDVYISYNNGVNWSLAPEAMQLSDKLPHLSESDVVVAGYDLTADLSEAWSWISGTKGGTRSSYTIDGYDITWICPYLYVFGGYSFTTPNELNTSIYRGVLQRLKYTPVI